MNMTGGIHIIEPDPKQLKIHLEDGFNFLAYSLDIRMIDVTGRAGLNYFSEMKK